VFEAVLDDGARPTIPGTRLRRRLLSRGLTVGADWVGTTMQSLITDCLKVIPAKRPTFMELIARLTQAFHLSPKTIVKLFDVKRLLFLLDNARPAMQVFSFFLFYFFNP
jgi:hypothetical protein